ncbi:hypothetical protein MRB53_012212 [Persea americana]|uniref:Uncharacterized protein n=1 Tax=Persea americana TaxID=3435 RepID=A0ACC2LX15_PERAE|nr:hypothetical protein MRB53_012212 [Persea americana]
MEVSFPFHLVRCISAISALLGVASATVFCPPQTLAFVSTLESQCPLSLSTELPAALEVAGEFLEGALSSDQSNTHTSILFYASWCPFSQSVRSTFDILSSMFPQIKHFTVEESSIMPVVFSRYGVHSLPSILIANQTSSTRYCGSKDLSLLIPFYKRTTGFDPLVDFTKHESSYLGSLKSLPWDGLLPSILPRYHNKILLQINSSAAIRNCLQSSFYNCDGAGFSAELEQRRFLRWSGGLIGFQLLKQAGGIDLLERNPFEEADGDHGSNEGEGISGGSIFVVTDGSRGLVGEVGKGFREGFRVGARGD